MANLSIVVFSFFLLTPMASAEEVREHGGTHVHGGAGQAGRSRERAKDRFTYSNCDSSDHDYGMLMRSGGPLVEMRKQSADEKTNSRAFQLGFKDSAEGIEMKTLDLKFGPPATKSGGLTVWKTKIEVEIGTKQELQISYIEQGPEPMRKVFVVQYPPQPRTTFSANDGLKGNGTFYGLSAFDNRGNYVAVGSEIDSSEPPRKIAKTNAYCRGDRGSDFMGFDISDVLQSADDPALFPRVIYPEEHPRKKVEDKGEAGGNLYRSTFSDPGVRKKLAQNVIADKDRLSPARERFAKSLLDGSYKDNPAFQLRQAILAGVKYVAPDDRKKAAALKELERVESESLNDVLKALTEGSEADAEVLKKEVREKMKRLKYEFLQEAEKARETPREAFRMLKEAAKQASDEAFRQASNAPRNYVPPKKNAAAERSAFLGELQETSGFPKKAWELLLKLVDEEAKEEANRIEKTKKK